MQVLKKSYFPASFRNITEKKGPSCPENQSGKKHIYCANLSRWMHVRERWQNLDFYLKRTTKK